MVSRARRHRSAMLRDFKGKKQPRLSLSAACDAYAPPLLAVVMDMTSLVHSSMPICAINPGNRSVTVIVRLMRFMKVRTYEQRKIWKVIFMDYQHDEILGIMEGDDAINRWNSILKAGNVYHISGLSVDAATDGERNVVTNNLKLVFTPRTRLEGVINDCSDIPYQHLPSFVSFIDVPRCLKLHDNIIDIIGMVVALSPLEKTRTRGTAKRELLLSNMRMQTLRLTLWGDFAEVEGTYLQQHLYEENILLASRVHIRVYEGISVSTLPISRLLINPDIQTTEDFEGWYSGTRGVMRHFDFMRNRTLRIVNLEKLFAAKRIRLNEYVAMQSVRYFRIFAYVDEIYPLLYDACTICKRSANTYVFALNVPYCTCATPSLTERRYIFRVLLRDHTGYRAFIVRHEDARVLLHTSTIELDSYASQPYGHLSLYAIIDDYIGKPWVFVVEPPQHHEVELPITLIAPVSWEEEVFYLRNTDARYKKRRWILHHWRHKLTYQHVV